MHSRTTPTNAPNTSLTHPPMRTSFKLSADQREALIKLDLPTIVKMGAHPLVPFLAQMQIQRLRPQR